MEKTAEVFLDGGHQAVRLPESIRVFGDSLMVHQNEATGEITLSPLPRPLRQKNFDKLFEMLDALTQEERDAFVIPRDTTPPTPRDIWK